VPILPLIAASTQDLTAIFRDLHAHPEIGFREHRTASRVAEMLRRWGVDEVHEGLGGTGVVGLIHGRRPGNRRVGLRADMDALPITEQTGLAHASVNPGTMHACGHDGHTTMLLGAARYLAATRDFEGTAVVIFQPAEEGLGGARRMLEEGLFRRFPCDEVYGFHNAPNGKPGRFALRKGPAMAGASFFDITVSGKGSHAAMPHESRDAVLAAATLIQQLQSVVSRNVPPQDACVLSVTRISAGSAYNVLPESASLGGTLRFFSHAVRDLAQERMHAICGGLAIAQGVTVDVRFHEVFDVLVNSEDQAEALLAAAGDVLGADATDGNQQLVTGSEDFADMLQRVPGAYGWLGHAGTMPLHSPSFVLDESILPVGASIYARIVERQLKPAAA
jgi:hippurate hydrolase